MEQPQGVKPKIIMNIYCTYLVLFIIKRNYFDFSYIFYNEHLLTLLSFVHYNLVIMLKNVLRKIGMNLTSGRPKIIFGPIDKEDGEMIFSYVKKLVEGSYPDVEFFEGEKIKEFKSLGENRLSRNRACLLIDDIFKRDDFAVLINQAYGNENVILIGLSRYSDKAIDYNLMTLIGGRYESYYWFGRSFSDLHDADFIAYLSKGERLFNKGGDYSSRALRQVAKSMKLKKPEELKTLFDVIMKNAGKPYSVRELAKNLPVPLSPNTVIKYLDAYENAFLLHRIEGFDFLKMRQTERKFRLYPYDTSLYSFNLREAAGHVDLLSLTPLLGRLKEEGYECHYGYFHQQRMGPAGSRIYRDEDIGLYAKKDRELIFALNIGGENDPEPNLLRLSGAIERYIVYSGSSKRECDARGLYHVGIEYLLSDEFDYGRNR